MILISFMCRRFLLIRVSPIGCKIYDFISYKVIPKTEFVLRLKYSLNLAGVHEVGV